MRTARIAAALTRPGGELATAVAVVLAATATYAASAPWSRAYPPGAAAPLLAGASASAVLVPALVARLLRRRAWWSIGASLVAFVVFAVFAPGGVGSFAELGRGFSDGLARLLSESLPVSTPRGVLVPALAATWCTGAASGELVARERAASGAAAVLTAGFALAEALTASAPGQPVTAAVALVALLAALLVVGRRPGPGELVAPSGEAAARPSPRRGAFGFATLVLAVAAGGLVVPELPGFRASPARLARPAPVRPSEPLTPTATMVQLRNAPVHPLFRVTFDRPSTGYLSVASLDAYDGADWSFSRLFEPSGGRVPEAPAQPVGRPVVQRYRILAKLQMPWMPYLDPPVDVGGVPIEVSRTTMVMPASPLQPGARFRVVSDPSGARLATARARALAAGPEAPPSPEDLAVPPSENRDLAGLAHQLAVVTHTSTATPLPFLRAAEADLAAHGRTIRSHHGARHRPVPSDTTFADTLHAVVVARRATPEQYATCFALLARHLGVPARVVTGFRLAPAARGRATRPGHPYTVTSADAWTWTELAVRGLGWIVADPSPTRTGAAPLPRSSTAPPAPTTTLPAARAVPQPSSSGHAVAPRVHIHVGGTGLAGIVAALAALAGLALAALAGLAGARFRRRRHRRQGQPADRAAGAWLEALEALEAADLGPLDALTAHEVVERARARFGPEAGTHLGTVAGRAQLAVYGTDPARLDEADAQESWSELAALRRSVRRALPWHRRLRAALAFGVSARRRPQPDVARRRQRRRGGGPGGSVATAGTGGRRSAGRSSVSSRAPAPTGRSGA